MIEGSPRKKIIGIERNVFFLGIVSFFNDFSNEMILSVFPAFFKVVLKSGAASLGLVEGIADAASNFIKIFSGAFSDKSQRRKKIAVIGYVISVFSRPFYLLASSSTNVGGLRLIDRVGKGVREAPRDALISLASRSDELGKSFGYHRAMDSFGAILGPLAAYFILRNSPDNFNVIFITSFVLGLFGLITFFFVKESKGVIEKIRAHMPSFKNFPRKFKFFILSISILSAGAIPLAVILLRTQDLGFSIASIPLFYLVYNASFTAFSFAAGNSADRIGDRKLITLGYLILLAGYGVLIYANSALTLVLGFILLGLYSALTEGIQRSYVARITEQHLRGEAYGFLSAGIGFGSLIAGIGGGALWQVFGAVPALVTGSLIVVCGLLMLQTHARSY